MVIWITVPKEEQERTRSSLVMLGYKLRATLYSWSNQVPLASTMIIDDSSTQNTPPFRSLTKPCHVLLRKSYSMTRYSNVRYHGFFIILHGTKLSAWKGLIGPRESLRLYKCPFGQLVICSSCSSIGCSRVFVSAVLSLFLLSYYPDVCTHFFELFSDTALDFIWIYIVCHVTQGLIKQQIFVGC